LSKNPSLTAKEAENLLFKAGFILLRTQGSHQIYFKDNVRVVIPFHSNKILHPKIIRQILKAVENN
jgi:predicted RNA binding protein YcfA (HicA-like mRNA interferase family)